MKIVALLLAPCLALALCAGARGQVPDSGRWQELRYASEEVALAMEDRYISQVVELAAQGRLDEDRPLLRRLQAIGAGLLQAAAELKPESAQWDWEFHVTSAPEVDAICLAGGKILVGAAFVGRLMLDDGELATLLGHEIAHAVAEHHRETLSEALLLIRPYALPPDVMLERLDSDLSLQLRLSRLSHLQEREADQLGMVLAHRAGWPARAMVSFYRKLAAEEGAPALLGAYPIAWARQTTARGMARLFGE
ncbi:M48 family metalloprotease [Massilia sp. BJB1822]|uniref:M48 family metalloprotease n=1 Tax=Massilia sp. BJB1822 TaxID=2744470 RepID=UPI001592B27F|nr:M48 family metalloprotease [Massilia sp. BJB1822]NVE01013.1 M48 family metalloprotease [Massilia sp. BJB1822]